MRILVDKTKHGDNYYSANDARELGKAALHILTERLSDSWIFEPEEPERTGNILDEYQINNLPSEYLQEKYKGLQAAHQQRLVEYKLLRSRYDAVVETVRDQDETKAWEVLQTVSDYEYGHVYIAEVMTW